MKAILLAIAVFGALLPALPAGPHYDRSYEALYRNPKQHWMYRHTYAGHYVREERPFSFQTFYERSRYPNGYGTRRYRGPEHPTPKVTVHRTKPPFYNPEPVPPAYPYGYPAPEPSRKVKTHAAATRASASGPSAKTPVTDSGERSAERPHSRFLITRDATWP
jgi:hypothetical protein